MKALRQVLIFIGPPGAGKGTLSQRCVKELGWTQLSTGDLCRQNIADRTELGNQIDFFIRSGKLIPDALMIDMVEEWLLKRLENIDVLILDGFPRTVVQAQALDELLRKPAFVKVKVSIVQLAIDDDIVTRRLLSRLVCPNKQCGMVYSTEIAELKPRIDMQCDRCPGVSLVIRSDDTADSIKHRLAVYHKHAQELTDYYNKQGRNGAVVLQVNKPLHEVFADFKKTLGH